MKRILKAIADVLLGDYSAFRVYAFSGGGGIVVDAESSLFGPVDRMQVEASPDALIASHAIYHRRDTFAFAWFADGRIVAVCYYWHGEQYRTRNFWPLAHGEAKLVQIVTAPEYRGRGVATKLIACSSATMNRNGFRCLYARIWHSNTTSLRAFQRAGWTRRQGHRDKPVPAGPPGAVHPPRRAARSRRVSRRARPGAQPPGVRFAFG